MTVSARAGAEFMSPYYNPFEETVIAGQERTLGRARDRSRTAAANRLTAAGAFGGSASALESALIEQDFMNTLADSAGQLRARNFEFAGTMGQADANRDLTAQGMNQSSGLTADMSNRDARLRSDMFDVTSANENMRFRGDMAGRWANTLGAGMQLDNPMLMNLFNAGGAGYTQDLNWLRQFLPLFGAENDSSGTTNQTGTANQTGTSSGTGGTTNSPGFWGTVGGVGNLLSTMGNLGWNPFASQADFGPAGRGAYPEWTNPWAWAQA